MIDMQVDLDDNLRILLFTDSDGKLVYQLYKNSSEVEHTLDLVAKGVIANLKG